MESPFKLTALSRCAGCGAKAGAGALTEILGELNSRTDENLLVGFRNRDDAAVYRINENCVLIQTVDFFPPIVDSPYLYGQIAAANALSDVYAMGGMPKLALNLLCIPEGMERDCIREILRGGSDKVREADAVIAGGHTIHGGEPIYGLSVSGFAAPEKILTNSGARPGDCLILTKALGVGILTTAAKAELAPKDALVQAHRQMSTLNKSARDIMVQFSVNACTDVTGFSLLGHALEMARGSGCSLHIETAQVPCLTSSRDLAQMGLIPAAAYRNREFAENDLHLASEIDRAILDILFDPQTSGGLLISIPEKEAPSLLNALQSEIPNVAIIGYVTESSDYPLILH